MEVGTVFGFAGLISLRWFNFCPGCLVLVEEEVEGLCCGWLVVNIPSRGCGRGGGGGVR